jgi:hypothetical protein
VKIISSSLPRIQAGAKNLRRNIQPRRLTGEFKSWHCIFIGAKFSNFLQQNKG